MIQSNRGTKKGKAFDLTVYYARNTIGAKHAKHKRFNRV